MKIAQFKEKATTDFNSEGWKLLERVVKALDERGLEPDVIEGLSINLKEGKVIFVETVYRHNGTNENVNVKLAVAEHEGHRIKHLIEVKVPKDASDKVINNRIDKITQYLN